MKPLNQKERNQSYLIFAILFLIGIGIVSIPFYSMYRDAKTHINEVKEENEELNKTNNELNKWKEREDEFILKIDEISNMIDSMETAEDLSRLSTNIGIRIANAEGSISDIPAGEKQLYVKLLDTYSILKETLKDKIENEENSSKSVSEISDLKEKIQDLKEEKKDLEGKLKKCEDLELR